MEAVEGTIKIAATILCPHCDTQIDLLDAESLNDDLQLSRIIAEDEGAALENYQEELDCPDCFKNIQIKGLSY